MPAAAGLDCVAAVHSALADFALTVTTAADLDHPFFLSSGVLCFPPAVVFVLWAWVPDSMLQAVGVTYYPNK